MIFWYGYLVGGLSFLFCLWLVTHIATCKRLNKDLLFRDKKEDDNDR